MFSQTQNLNETRKVYSGCSVFCSVFRENTRKMWNTISVAGLRIMISLRDRPHMCNAIITIFFIVFRIPFTYMANYWPVELETWVEGKWRDMWQVCSVANPGGKKFLDTQCVYQNLLLYYVVFSAKLPINIPKNYWNFHEFSKISSKFSQNIFLFSEKLSKFFAKYPRL